MPMAAMLAPGWWASTPRTDCTVAPHQSSGSCSAHPGRGVDSASGVVALAMTSPSRETRIALTPLVPTSRPRNAALGTSASSEQELHRQLVEALVRVAAIAQGGKVEAQALDPPRFVRREADTVAGRRPALAQFGQQRLDFGVRVEPGDLLLEDQVGAHATGREIPDAGFVLGAVGVAVEVAHAVPRRVREQLHERS